MYLRSFLNGIFNYFYDKNNNCQEKSNQAIYRIVGKTPESDYLLHCVNTSAVIAITINEIFHDKKILSGLSQKQACYLGIEYYLSVNKNENFLSDFCIFNVNGLLSLKYYDRHGNVCFQDVKTKKEYCMDPRDIALSTDILNKFESIQAFYIGILCAIKRRNNNQKTIKKDQRKYYKYLEIIK